MKESPEKLLGVGEGRGEAVVAGEEKRKLSLASGSQLTIVLLNDPCTGFRSPAN